MNRHTYLPHCPGCHEELRPPRLALTWPETMECDECGAVSCIDEEPPHLGDDELGIVRMVAVPVGGAA